MSNPSAALHPEVLAYFDAQRAEQQHHVATAQVQRTLRQTVGVTMALMDKMIARGLQMDEGEARAAEVERASAAFAGEARAWNCVFPALPYWCQRVGADGDEKVTRMRLRTSALTGSYPI